MKKTISINISGFVFYIEEDGYDKLKTYLSAIQQYFARYEGSQEIIADIEGRISEKFADKLHKEEKQAISLEDVDQLIASMGTVADFEALEEQEDLATPTSESAKTEQTTDVPPVESISSSGKTTGEPRKLYRDMKRRLLGGVCAGVAHYFSTDPLWVRLIVLAFFFGWFIFPAFAPFLTVLYIACWVAFPPSTTLEEDEKLKKLYRNPEQKVLGGVVAGIAAYTGWDLGLLRLIFALSILFFGTGVILYLVLWAISPEAKTLTDKMQMTGEPITLENIETNIKRATSTEGKTENTITKILLLPFRAIAAIFGALGPFLSFLVAAARIFAGGIMLIASVSAVFGLLVALGVGLGILTNLGNVVVGSDDFPIAMLARDAQPMMFVFAFLAIVTPFVAAAVAGVSLIAKRNMFSPAIWQSLLGLFLAGVLGSAILIPRYVNNFSRRGDVELSQAYNVGGKTLVLVLDDEGGNHNFQDTHLRLEGYDSTTLKLTQEFVARGKSREDAKVNAQNITYRVEQKDSVLTFDRNFDFKDNAMFRAQRLNMVLYLPYDKPFVMTRRMAEFVSNEIEWNRIAWTEKGQSEWGMATARFQFSKDDGLVCLDERPEAEIEQESRNNDQDNEEDGMMMGQGEYQQTFTQKDFNKLEIGGAFYVEVRKGDTFKVELDGDRRDVERINVEKRGNSLVISHKEKFRLWRKQDRVNVRIEMPDLEGVNFSGATKATVKGFDKNGNLDIEISGASQATFTGLNAANIDAEITGASRLTLLGAVANFKADLSGASKLKAYDLKADKADVDASGASGAEVNAIKYLRATASGASSVNYRGRSDLKVETSGSGVNREEGDYQE